MKKVMALVMAAVLLCVCLTAAFALEGEQEFCPVCKKDTLWYTYCTGREGAASRYTYHVLLDGRICNKYSVAVNYGIRCRICGNQKVQSATHPHIKHEYCSTEYTCK